MPRRGENVDKEKMIESKGCQERGEGKIHKKKIIENISFQNKAQAGGGKQIIQSMGCQDEAGGKKINKKKIIESIESMGCQERGWGKF